MVPMKSLNWFGSRRAKPTEIRMTAAATPKTTFARPKFSRFWGSGAGEESTGWVAVDSGVEEAIDLSLVNGIVPIEAMGDPPRVSTLCRPGHVAVTRVSALVRPAGQRL